MVGAERAKPELKKELGLFETTIYGIGIILGAGIYAIIGEGAGLAGNALWLSFLIAAIIASFTGLSYAELTSMYPRAAAEYVYTKKAFNRESLAFVLGFVIIIAGIISGSTVALGFAGYFSSLFGTGIIPIAIILLVLLSILNFVGIKESAKFNIISTLIEFSGLIIIILIALPYLGSVDYFFVPGGFSGIMAATALIFFAFIGFEDLANISEETKNAHSTIPKALLISLIVSTILYILVSISAVSVLGWETLSMSSAPLTDVAVAGWGPSMIGILSVIALFATGNTVLIMLIVVSRMIYGMSRGGSLPGFLSRLHIKRRTPFISIFLVMALAIVFTFIGNIGMVASLTNAGIFISFFFVNLSVIFLRFRRPGDKRPFRTPINIGRFPLIPFLGTISCLLIFLYFDPIILLAESVIIILGYILYLFLKHRRS